MDVNVEIEEIVVSDIDLSPAQAEALKATVSEELTALFSRQRMADWSGIQQLSTDDFMAPAIHVDTVPRPEQIGRQLADSIFQVLTATSNANDRSGAMTAAKQRNGRH